MKRIAVAVIFALTFAGEPMGAQETAPNEAFIRQCLELLTQSTVDKYMECWADTVSNNGQAVVTRDRLRETVVDIVTTFPDFKFEILKVVAQGDTVVAQVKQQGTHRGVAKGEFNGGGLRGVAPTGKRMDILATHWFTIKDGKIVTHQAVREDLRMMRQLGLAADAPAPTR
jgi:predicted ester cyclase